MVSLASYDLSVPTAAEEEAYRLLLLGYIPLPIAQGGKHPAIKWKSYHSDSIPSVQSVHRWYKEHPSWQLCITPRNFIIIDIDGADNPWPEDPEQRLDLLDAPTVMTPSGGWHHWFRLPEGLTVKNSSGVIADRVDVRTTKGIAVVPPTTKSAGCYRWADDEPVSVPPSELPLLPSWLADLLRNPDQHKPISATVEPMQIAPGLRNSTLTRMAGYYRRGGAPYEVLLAALQAHNKLMKEGLPEGEIETIARSVATYDPDQVTVAVNEQWYEQDNKVDVDKGGHDTKASGGIPEELMHIPGFIDRVMSTTIRHAPRPNKPLAFAGACTLMSMLCGRKLVTARGARGNINVIALGDTGIGKNMPREVNVQILSTIGHAKDIADDFASGQGMEDALYKSPSLLAQLDEMDVMMHAIKVDRTGTRQYMYKTIMTLFSASSSVFNIRRKAGDEDVKSVYLPNMILFGTATPEKFYDAISPRSVEDGFLGRMIIIEACKFEQMNADRKPLEITDDILLEAKWWMDFQPGGNLGNEYPAPRLVSVTPEARQALDKYNAEVEKRVFKGRSKGYTVDVAVLNRASEHPEKWALLYAASQNYADPVINTEAAEWAIEFARHATERTIEIARGDIAQNEFDSRAIKIIRLLRKAPRQTLPARAIHQKTRFGDMRTFNGLVESLLFQGKIDKVTLPGKTGAEVIAYRLVD